MGVGGRMQCGEWKRMVIKREFIVKRLCLCVPVRGIVNLCVERYLHSLCFAEAEIEQPANE